MIFAAPAAFQSEGSSSLEQTVFACLGLAVIDCLYSRRQGAFCAERITESMLLSVACGGWIGTLALAGRTCWVPAAPMPDWLRASARRLFSCLSFLLALLRMRKSLAFWFPFHLAGAFEGRTNLDRQNLLANVLVLLPRICSLGMDLGMGHDRNLSGQARLEPCVYSRPQPGDPRTRSRGRSLRRAQRLWVWVCLPLHADRRNTASLHFDVVVANGNILVHLLLIRTFAWNPAMWAPGAPPPPGAAAGMGMPPPFQLSSTAFRTPRTRHVCADRPIPRAGIEVCSRHRISRMMTLSGRPAFTILATPAFVSALSGAF